MSQKNLGHFFTAYNFINIEQIFTKFGTNQSLINSEHRARVYLNQLWKIVAPSSE